IKRVLGDGWEVEQHVRGAEMLDWRYRGPFDELPAVQGVEHRVIPWTDVSQEEGTGIVHIAPGCGEEDFLLGKEFGLPAIAPLDENGVYVDGFDWLSGKSVGEVAKPITDNLRQKGVLFKAEQIQHRYPHCWRCGTELIFRLVDEWFISMDELRHQIADVTKQVRWIPDFGLARELDWLKNMDDWMISKKRYYGLALPIYSCDACGAVHHRGIPGAISQLVLLAPDDVDGAREPPAVRGRARTRNRARRARTGDAQERRQCHLVRRRRPDDGRGRHALAVPAPQPREQ